MKTIFLGFVNNAALLITLGVAYGALRRRTDTLAWKIASGMVLGIVTVGVMLNPWELQPGVFFDTRPIVLCIGGMFLGTVPTCIAALIGVLFRIHAGGPGVFTGSLWVIVASLWGLAWLRARKRPAWKISALEYYGLGLSLSVVLLLLMFTMPDNMAILILQKISLPTLTIFPVVTVLLAWLFANFDIRQENRRKLEESERRYKQLVEEAKVIILRTDRRGRILFVNDFGQKLLGYGADELKGQPLLGTIVPLTDSRGQDLSALVTQIVAEPGEYPEAEIECVSRDGKHYFIDWKIEPSRNVEGKYSEIQCIGQDVSEKKIRQAQAIRTAQLASLGELSAGVAHEINNPVTGIINYAIMIHSESSQPLLKEIASKIVREGERISQTVKSLLTFAREDSEEYAVRSLREIVDDTLALMKSLLIKDGIEIQLSVPEKTCEALCNAHQLEQVFINLLSNSRYTLNRKYPAGAGNKKIEIAVQNDSPGFLRVCFTDYGEGITDNLKERIFSPFFTTKAPGEGTGLGLSICHEIIQLHGGRMHVESVPGEYTTFILDLPSPA